MIKEITVYTIICDNCGKDVNKDSGYSGWDDKDYVLDVARESDWHTEEDSQYCPDCFTYDDDDNIVIKTENKKP